MTKKSFIINIIDNSKFIANVQDALTFITPKFEMHIKNI
jgi:hypothetical protein